jgi:hypothetical protein
VQTTARYAHLAADPIRIAADQVSGQIAVLLSERAALSSPQPSSPQS